MSNEADLQLPTKDESQSDAVEPQLKLKTKEQLEREKLQA